MSDQTHPPLIEVSDLTKEYLTLTALSAVCFTVHPGESVGLLGSNGAGKSTLLHVLMGFLVPDDGEALLFGVPPSRMSTREKERVGFVPEDSGLPPWATLEETARLFSSLYHRWSRKRFDRLIDEWEIPADQRLNTLSRGERRLAELALCFSTRPDLFLFDEPLQGLDAVMRIRVINELKEMIRRDGITLFCSSHILSDVEKLAERILIIRAGEIALDERIDRLNESIEDRFFDLYGVADGSGPRPGE